MVARKQYDDRILGFDDPVRRNDVRSCVRIFYEARNARRPAARAYGICRGRYDRGVIEELIPEATRDDKTDVCTIGFAVGFALMMVLDVALS